MLRWTGSRLSTATRPRSEDRLDQLDVAHPACCVKRRAPINTAGGFVETEAEHEVRRLPTTIEDGVRQT